MIADLFRLDGCVAFVSGAAGHLGRAMTRALCEAGAHTIVNGRDDARLRDFEGELNRQGFSCERAAFDMSDFERLRAFFAGRERLRCHRDRVVDQHVQPVPPCEESAYQCDVAHVECGAFAGEALALQFAFEILEPRIVASVDDRVRARFAQRKRHGASQMAGGAGNERRAAVQAEQIGDHRFGHSAGLSRFSGRRGTRVSTRAHSSSVSGRFTASRRLVSSCSKVSSPITTPSMKLCPLA